MSSVHEPGLDHVHGTGHHSGGDSSNESTDQVTRDTLLQVTSTDQSILASIIHNSLSYIDDSVPGDVGHCSSVQTPHHTLTPGNTGVGVQHSSET